MKYNQPYGVSDPEGPYINGNPSTGTMGSIPPAASIEYPQREIVNLIKDVNLATPDNADLRQLAKAVQSTKLWSVDDAGTVNQYSVTLSPPPGMYYRYLTVVAWITVANTGGANLNVNAMGAKPIVRSDGSELVAGDIGVNTLNCFVYDGAKFRVVWLGRDKGATGFLQQNLTFYVNFATGDDANDGSAAVLASGHGPFKTLQRASDIIGTFNLNGHNVTVNVADNQSYISVNLPASAGNGNVNWIGNAANPANCLITGTNRNAVAVGGVCNTMTGFKVTTAGAAMQDTGAGIHAQGATTASFMNMEWGQCKGPHVFAYGGAYVRLGGPKRISGGATNHSYGRGCFIDCQYGGKVDCIEVSPAQPLTIIGTPTYDTAFIAGNMVGVVAFIYSTLTGNSIGKRYDAQYNSVIGVGGGGVNYLPGTIAGTVATGGQYA
ncbi:hypothetical protein [Bradyrhizobium sp. 170]|uniref:hypothetical protein n=1 Tax=Bradyrhizobium sp. 170 TaxID=2782641 RepID=UPI001FFE5505|nr:hypothetical protein [Bradyrhizobium sp. 170]UPK03092.1 hypothetical protein IVB05_37040 [Bradyrhizobium sp. 170]